MVIARDMNASNRVQDALRDIALGVDGALFDMKRTPKQQLREHELTALKIVVVTVSAAVEGAEADSLRHIVGQACRLASQWTPYLRLTGGLTA